MGKNFLVAMDESNNADRAVDFIAKTFAKDHYITLFSVLPDSTTLIDKAGQGLTPYFRSQQAAFHSIVSNKKKLTKESLQKARKKLIDSGFSESHINVKYQIRKQGIARDIIKESESGYDMIIIGRRGLSGIKEFVMGSITQKIIHETKQISVLVVN